MSCCLARRVVSHVTLHHNCPSITVKKSFLSAHQTANTTTTTIMVPPSDANGLASLASQVDSYTSLATKLSTAIHEVYKSPSTVSQRAADAPSTTAVDALALSRDAATLARAQATKISLLIINEPFTASAVATVVKESAASSLPALATAVEACEPGLYTAAFRKELAWRCRKLITEFVTLLDKIPKDGKVVPESERQGFSQTKGSVATTGVLWAAADDVIKLANQGVAEFFVQKVTSWRDTLQDVMEELKEWGDEEPDDDDDDDDTAHEYDDDVDNTQQMIDDFMSGQGAIPKDDPDSIRPRLESSIRRIRLVLLLYQAVIKRRVKKLPVFPITASDSTVTKRLDEAAAVLNKLPDGFTDLAAAFYELDADAIDESMDQCFLDAFASSELFSHTWTGERDEFSDWAEKFQQEIKKA